MDDITKSSLITQGVTAGFFSQYIHAMYIEVLPWLIPALPLILLVCKYGRQNALAKGEEVTWIKTIKMADDMMDAGNSKRVMKLIGGE